MSDDARAWDRVKEVFHAALERTPEARAVFLREACGEDRDLFAEVESLLVAHERAGNFVEQPAIGALAGSDAMALTDGRESPDHALMPGDHLGPYRIADRLGAGGMGEVYSAHDTRLGRTVAIKVLPPSLRHAPELKQRFEREAKALALLSHPHICPVFDVGCERLQPARDATQNGDADMSIDFLVMEYLEGETLAARLERGGYKLDDALQIAIQIASALDAAHRAGIVHRDLKPGNVMLTRTGAARQGSLHAKLVDFGLAKTTAPGAAIRRVQLEPDGTAAPTTPPSLTTLGTILGTFEYMAPEQIEGRKADARTDLFAFGTVLYEMLAGKKPFTGNTPASLLSAILKDDPPPISTVEPLAPPALDHIVSKCLAKEPEDRWQTARDLLDELKWVAEGGSKAGATARTAHLGRPNDVQGQVRADVDDEASGAAAVLRSLTRSYGWHVAAVLAILGATLAVFHFWEKPSVGEPVRLQIPLPETITSNVSNFALSPDGRQLAFFAAGRDGVMRIWVRALDSLETRALPGSEVAGGQTPFFWSHDSRFIVRGAGGQLMKISVGGGPAQALGDLSDLVVGGSWNAEGEIVFGSARGGIMRVSAAGGMPVPVTMLDSARNERNHTFPVFLPDGRRFLYLRNSSSPENRGIYVGSLDARPEEQSSQRLLATSFGPAYVVSSESGSSQVLFVRDETLLAQGFDVRRLELVGDPVPVAERIVTALAFGSFSVSADGVLVYKTGRAQDYQLTWLDRQGKVVGHVGEPGLYTSVTLSPDERRAALVREDSPTGQRQGIWLLDLSRGTSTRLTFRGFENVPVWSPDGSRIVYTRAGELYEKPVNGGADETLLLESSENGFPSSWSRDGFVLYAAAGAKTKMDLWTLPIHGDRKPIPLLRTEFNDSRWEGRGLEGLGEFSPDGRWIAYMSDESGRFEVYVRSFAGDAFVRSSRDEQRWVISKGALGGIKWRADGKELTYVASDGNVIVVDVRTGQTVSFGAPKALFTLPPGVIAMDQTADGRRWLVAVPVALSTPTPLTVVLNWQVGLTAQR